MAKTYGNTGNFKDITGQKFENLTAIKRIGINKSSKTVWLFHCDCGVEKVIGLSQVLSGKIKNCGCLKIAKIPVKTGIFKDIAGQKFGRLTAIKRIGANKTGQSIWLFNCECGTQKEIVSSSVVGGDTKSCGCLQKSMKNRQTHGCTETRLYIIWGGMKTRCNNINSGNYSRYGGRGIQVCDEWHDFSKFQNWSLNNGYSDDLSIDRIDSNGNYCPENCKFSTTTEQARNKRNTVCYEIDGVKKPLTEWCELLDIPIGIANTRRRADKNPFLNEYNETRVYI